MNNTARLQPWQPKECVTNPDGDYPSIAAKDAWFITYLLITCIDVEVRAKQWNEKHAK